MSVTIGFISSVGMLVYAIQQQQQPGLYTNLHSYTTPTRQTYGPSTISELRDTPEYRRTLFHATPKQPNQQQTPYPQKHFPAAIHHNKSGSVHFISTFNRKTRILVKIYNM
jgi:hypothetical protein